MNLGQLDVSSSITAAGTAQTGATLLINGINYVGTTPASSGVILNANATIGAPQVVFNGGANSLIVYPPIGSKINNLSTNAGHTLGTNTTCQYWQVTSTQWIGLLSA